MKSSSPDTKKADAKLAVAYREGLGLVAVAVASDSAGVRIVADPPLLELMPESTQALRWCRNADEAKRVAASANASLRRRISEGDRHAVACNAIAHAAKRLNVMLRTEDDITAEAAIVVGRVVREFEQMRTAGDLREVNVSYRDYRLAASARGERIVPYAQWMRVYLENLVRQAAVTLKQL